MPDYFTGPSHQFQANQLLDEMRLLVRQLVELGVPAPTLPNFDKVFPFKRRLGAMKDQLEALRVAVRSVAKPAAAAPVPAPAPIPVDIVNFDVGEAPKPEEAN